MTYILGLNSAYHESSACLIKDGLLVAIAEEERFNRKKHAKAARVDNPDELPMKALEYCLEKAGITFDQIDFVGYSLNPEVRLRRNTQHQHPYEVTPGDFGTKEGETTFYQKNLEVEQKIRYLGFKGKFFYLNHHDCHAASSYFVSAFDDAAVIVVDGIGEFESTTWYQGAGNKLRKSGSIEFPHSLGFLWEKVCKYLGFGEYDACKVMGLASYGDPTRYQEDFHKLITINPDGNFTIDDRIIQFRNNNYAGLEALFGLRKREESIKEVNTQTQPYANLAAAMQEITNDILVKLARTIQKETGARQLCLAGGVALNCVANGKLLEERIFEEIFIQPAAHDAGTSLGAAFYIWNQILNQPKKYVFDGAGLSAEYSEQEIKEALDKSAWRYTYEPPVARKTAELIADGKVVAWFQGAMELGPRALGNRSILCDPRKKDAVALLNHKVKHREPFRPFCPSVLADKATEWFEVDDKRPSPAKYMLAAFKVLEQQREIIPAVTHVDGTARIQMVESGSQQKYYELIKQFEILTGVPVLLNTSFNDQEPIVCSPADAIDTFLKTKIDYLVLGNFIVSRGDDDGQ